jgi:GNAT superfamily N-acetyltransferase
MSIAPYSLAPARSAANIEAVRALMTAYADWLGMDLLYQGFPAEVAGLPGRYAPPHGALLLARDRHGEPAGCIGLRPLDAEGCCEMKRLYVVPEARGHGLGRALVTAVVSTAARIGYREIRLDSLPSLAEATALYLAMGFRPIAPYYDTPIAETIFLGRPLTAPDRT